MLAADCAGKQAARLGELAAPYGPRQSHQVRYGGWSGKGDEIAMVTRSMLQVMLELGILAQVPETDIAGGKATPGVGPVPAPTSGPPLLNIMSGATAPPDAYAAIPYKGRWFWIAEHS
jgi:hypothetical protein